MSGWTHSAEKLGWLLWMAATAKSEAPRVATVEGIGDGALVERARGGDHRAKEQLYKRHGDLVLNTAARLLGDKQDAQDVAQEAFLYAFAKLDQLREPNKFRAWLLRITVVRVRRVIRTRQLRRRLGFVSTTDDASLRALASDQWSPEVRAQLGIVDEILRSMPTEHRLAWSLRNVEGYKLREVSELGGWSMSSTKRYIAAAQARISRGINFPDGEESGADDE